MFVVCYKNQFGTKTCAMTDDPTKWIDDNPSEEVLYVFNERSDVYQPKMQFALYANMFGFDASDYGRRFYNQSGKIQRLIGFKPSNRKYPVITFCEDDQKTYKQSASYARRRLEEAEIV